MKTTRYLMLALCAGLMVPAKAEVYSPTSKIGEFMKAFERAYRAGDTEWIHSAVDKDGITKEASAVYFGMLGPKEGGASIADLTVVAAPAGYRLSNSLLDVEIEPTIPVDFILTFQRAETKMSVPGGYRDGKIWLAGIKKK